MVKVTQAQISYILMDCQRQWNRYGSLDKLRVQLGIYPLAVSSALFDNIQSLVSPLLNNYQRVYFAEAVSGGWWKVPDNALLYIPSKNVVMWKRKVKGMPEAGWHVMSTEFEYE